MRKEYIKQVKRNLAISTKKRKDVVSDLQEIFASASEHGESEKQVIDRLGSPADFADSVNLMSGINRTEKQKRKMKYLIGVFFFVAAAAFAIGFFIKISGACGNIIGQSDSMTGIQIEGALIAPSVFFMITGVSALAVGIVLIFCYFRKNSR